MQARYLTGADLVRSFAGGFHRGSQVQMLISHVKDKPGTLRALLDDQVVGRLPAGADMEQAPSVDAFVAVLSGIGFLAFSFSPPSGEGRALTPVPTLTTLDVQPDLRSSDGDEGASDLLQDLSMSAFSATRPTTSVLDGTVTEEFLIELPDHGRHRAEDIHLSFLEPARAVAETIAGRESPLEYMHAPASPPVVKHQPQGRSGPFLRIGVAVPRPDPNPRIELGTALIDQCSLAGWGLWLRERDDPDSDYDYWHKIAAVRTDGHHRPRYGGGQATVGLTCVGPACIGSTAAVLRMLHHADLPLWGITATSLDDIDIIQLVTYVDNWGWSGQDLVSRSADDALSAVFGLRHWMCEEALKDHRLATSFHADRAPDTGHQVVWLAWSTPVSNAAMRITVDTARRAFVTAVQRRRQSQQEVQEQEAAWLPPGSPNIEYLVCRAVSADRQRGHMKLALDLHALEFLKDEANNLCEAKLASFCGEVRQQWHQDLAFRLGSQNIETSVAWRESWIGYRTSLRSARAN